MSLPMRGLAGQRVRALLAASLLWAAPGGPAAAEALAPVLSSRPGPLTGERAAELLRRIAEELEPALAPSRKALLGTRDPAGPTCVPVPTPQQIRNGGKVLPMSAGGGPGTALLAFWSPGTRQRAAEDLQWQQAQLRPAIQALLARSRAASGRVGTLHARARELAEGLGGWATWPRGLWRPDAAVAQGHWPATCLRALQNAIAGGDLPAARRWSQEFAAATFALDDLHRWTELLLENYLALLDYQTRCDEMFAWVDALYGATAAKYASRKHQDHFPASTGLVPLTENLYEVERQAEGLFRPLPGPAAIEAEGLAGVPAAVWMPPQLRKDFLQVRGRLSPAAQAAWDHAAGLPFERSYLVNMLFRASKAGALGTMADVLERRERIRPAPTHAELMGAIFYRGEISSGAMWGDRYDSRLLRPAERMTGSRQQVLQRAHRLASDFLGGWDNYGGGIWTLREALDARRLDCVRGTDMIGALYRNAGRSGFACVHLSCGVASHSLAAVEVLRDGRREVVLADPLEAQPDDLAWPAEFYRGHPWPEGYPGPRGPAWSAELYVRGLDNYLFAEGYAIRGRNAGWLVRTAVPYLPGREKPDARKVHPGPYPPVPQTTPAPRRPALPLGLLPL